MALWTLTRNTAGRCEQGQGRELLGKNAEFKLDVQGYWGERAGLIPSTWPGRHPQGCSGNVTLVAVCWGMAAEPEAVAATKSTLTHILTVPPAHTAITSWQPSPETVSLCSPMPQQPCLQTYALKSFASLPKYTPSPKPASRLTG